MSRNNAAGVGVGAGFVIGAAAGGRNLSAPVTLQNMVSDLMR